MIRQVFLAVLAMVLVPFILTPKAQAKNPIVKGWYADPEIRIYDGKYWIFPTYSDDFDTPDRSLFFTPWQGEQRNSPSVYPPFLKHTFFNAFSSNDLVNWTKHSHVLDVKNVSWAAYAVWAPSSFYHQGKYYLFFSANDIKTSEQQGGLGLAVSDRPEGPYVDAIGKPLIKHIVGGAQPIDPFVFRDDDGKIYLFYGGWGQCNVVRLSDDLKSLVPHEDGTFYKKITPENYVEGSFLIKRKGKYYFMWSEGDWTGPEYSVAYGMSDHPIGPFARIGKILAQDNRVARGAGHHSVVNLPGTDEWVIAYHRRPLDTDNGNHREMALEKLNFNEDGTIKPVVMTHEGVKPFNILTKKSK